MNTLTAEEERCLTSGCPLHHQLKAFRFPALFLKGSEMTSKDGILMRPERPLSMSPDSSKFASQPRGFSHFPRKRMINKLVLVNHFPNKKRVVRICDALWERC